MKRIRPSLLVGAAATAMALIPALVMARLLCRYTVNVLYWDEWMDDLGGLLPALHAGHLSLAQIFAQHNENWQVIPRILFLLTCRMNGGDPRWLMWCSWLLVGFTLYNLWKLQRITMPDAGNFTRLLLITLSSLLLFSPVQSANWQWGIQICCFLPIALLVLAARLAYSHAATATRWIGCAMLCLAGTLSYSNAVLMWVLVPVLLAFNKGARRKWPWIGWIALMGITAIIYGHQTTESHLVAQFVSLLRHPIRAALYLLELLGSPLAHYLPGSEQSSAVFGAVQLIILGWLSIDLLLRWRHPGYAKNAMIWMVMAVFALLTAVLITAGRMEIESALASRYCTFTLYLTVAVIHLAALRTHPAGETRHPRLGLAGAIAGLALGTLLAFNFLPGTDSMANHYARRIAAKGVLDWIDVLPQHRATLGNLGPDVNQVIDRAHQLNAIGWYHPPLLRSAIISDIAGPRGKFVYGKLESLFITPGGNIRASGWACLAPKDRPADLVVVCLESNGKETAFAVASASHQRDDLAAQYGTTAAGSGWVYTARDPRLTPATVISAWAFDADTGQAYRLDGPD